jgi:hypothetical protein
MNLRYSRFGGHNNLSNGNTALTMDQLRSAVPSAFALDKHGSRSERYTYIPTVNVIEGLMGEGFQPFKAMQGKSRVEGKQEFTKHLIRFRHQSQTLATVSDSAPEVILINSHDGTSSYKLIAGIFRMVCSNGLIVADSTVGSLSVPHKGDIVSQVIEGSFDIIGNSSRALETTREWQNLQLTAGEQNAFAEAAHELRFAGAEGEVTTPIQPAQLLNPRRDADNGNDLWRTFNRVQENVIRGGLHGMGRDANNRLRRVTTREVRGIDQDVKLNRAMWMLTEKMAELKGVGVAA